MSDSLLDDEPQQDDVLRVIRERVDAWRGFPLGDARSAYPREGSYEPVLDDERPLTPTSLALLRHWFRPEAHEVGMGSAVQLFKYWPHQRRAVETFIYLHEVCGARRAEDLWRLADLPPSWTQRDPWPKLGAQLATGAGKTKVMSLLIAWAYLNAVREPASGIGVGKHILVIAPGLFVRDRLLQDFLPGEGKGRSVFVADPVVPSEMEDDWDLKVYSPDTCPRSLDPAQGALVVTNFHQLLRETKDPAPYRGPRQMSMLFEESDPARLESVDLPLIERFRRSRGLFVLNDEAHHVGDEPAHARYEAARAAQARLDEDATLSMAWIGALRRLHGASTSGRLGLQVDLSATLFEERGGMKVKKGAKGPKTAARPVLFRHAAMRYELVEARNEDIVKRPALERVVAVKKGTDQREPLVDDGAPNAWEKYRHLLAAGIQRWVEVRNAHAQTGGRRPILFVVCDNRNEAAEVANYLRFGTATKEPQPGATHHGYEDPRTQERLFANPRSVLEVHIGAKEQQNEKEWAKVRDAVNAVDRAMIDDPDGPLDEFGHPAQVPNPVDVIVSVMMLKEGWDVRNVAVIVPLRPCDSRTLTEQILGRGLRKVHPPEVFEDGRAELLHERLYVIEHPSFAAIIDDLKDLVDQTTPDEPSPPPEYVLVEPRPAELDALDVRMARYEGQVEIVRSWEDTVNVAEIPAVEPRRPWRGAFDETEITTTLEEAQLAGREFGLQFVVPSKPTYRDFDHVLEAVYVLPMLKALKKSHQHMNAVKGVVREYLEQRVFDLPPGVPLSFEKALEQGHARIAMANLARRDVAPRVIERLQKEIAAAMERRLPSTQALVTTLRASEVGAYQARKQNVYESPARSPFTRAAMDSQDEARVAKRLDACADVLGWVYNHRKVGYSIGYEWRGRPSKYIPDFVVRARVGAVEHHVIIEVKGRFDDQDKRKAERGAAYARLLTAADGRPWHYLFLLESPSHKRRDITWWEQQTQPRIADLLRRHENLPLYPSGEARALTLLGAGEVPAADRFVRALPVYDLVAAAGGLGASQSPEPKGWLPVDGDEARDDACFIARMEGRSMERADGEGIPNGAWVLFRRWPDGAPPVRALDGRRALFESRDISDPEHGGRYTVKRLRVASLGDDGVVTAIELRSDNPDVAPLTLRTGEVSLTPVAEVVRVLG